MKLKKATTIIALIAVITLVATVFTACNHKPSGSHETNYTVTFDTNGGTGVPNFLGTSIPTSPSTTKADFVFAGWYDNSSCTGNALSFPYTVTANITLYAKWTESGSHETNHTVTFDTNGGTGVPNFLGTSISTSPSTTKANFVFAGWYDNSSCTGNALSFPYTVTTDITLYAKWAESELYPEPDINNFVQTTLSDYEYDVDNGTVVLTKYKGASEQIKLPSEANCVSEAFVDNDRVKSVYIPESYTDLFGYSFYQAPNITYIKVADNNTSYKDINGVLFTKDGSTLVGYPTGRNREAYSVPGGVSELSTYSFSGCSFLKYPKLPDSLQTIGTYAFYLSNIVSLEIPSNVDALPQGLFYQCEKLTSVTLNQGLGSIGNYAFYKCSSLKALDIPNGTTSIGKLAFCNCTSLERVSIPEGVTDFPQQLFEECYSLSSINFPNSLQSIDIFVFNGCRSLETAEFHEGLTLIDDYAFEGCSALARVSLPSSLIQLGAKIFKDCNSLSEIDAESSEYFKSVNSVLIDIKNKNVIAAGKYATVPSDGNVTKISPYAFSFNMAQTVSIPEGITEIGADAFSNCPNLESINIPASVTRLNSGAFKNCPSLATLSVASDNATYTDEGNCIIAKSGIFKNRLILGCKNSTIPTTGVNQIDSSAFQGCLGLKTLTLPSQIYIISTNAFSGCSNLESIDISNITLLGADAFSDCTSLRNVRISNNANVLGNPFKGCDDSLFTIENGIRYIGSTSNPYKYAVGIYNETVTSLVFNNACVQINDFAFQNCSVTSVTIPSSIKTIDLYAFDNCKFLSTVTILDGLTTIASNAFSRCTSLTTINIPDSVKLIDSGAFSDCTSISEIFIPSSVTSLGPAFKNWTVDQTIRFEATSANASWSNTWNKNCNAQIVWGATA